jgi:pimeloyl-ACP methyl ester carboxylesterase
MRATIRGTETHFVDRGAGRPLVLVHGLGESTFIWRHLIPRLERHFRVCAVDLPGFGESAPAADDDYSLDAMAEHVVALAGHLDLRDAVLVCHSFGGQTGIHALLRDPARFTGLVALDTTIPGIEGSQISPPFKAGFEALASEGVGESLMEATNRSQMQGILESLYSDGHVATDEEIEHFHRPYQTAEGRRAFLAHLRKFLGDGDRLASELHRIAVSTLIVWGANDQLIAPSLGRALSDRIRDSKLEIIEGCGHNPHEERPERVARAIVERFATA